MKYTIRTIIISVLLLANAVLMAYGFGRQECRYERKMHTAAFNEVQNIAYNLEVWPVKALEN